MLLWLSVVCASAWPQTATGDTARGWYLNGGLGLNHLDQEEGKDPKADIGIRVAAACGIQLDRHWALELDSGFIRNTSPDNPRTGRKQSPLSQIPMTLNALLCFPNPSKLEPFLGAGFGGTLAWTDEDTGGDATLAFKGGVRYGFSERVAIGIDYTFFMLGFTSAFIGEAVGDDTVNLGVRWMF
jgi:opacity protein-like surface antigen